MVPYNMSAGRHGNFWLREIVLNGLAIAIVWNLFLLGGAWEAGGFLTAWIAARWIATRWSGPAWLSGKWFAGSAARSAGMRADRRSGQMIIFVTLSLTVLISAVGLSVDLGYSYYIKILAQAAADSAAQAAAMYASLNGYACASGVACNSTYSCASPPVSPPLDPLEAGCLYANTNGFANTGNQTVSLIANNTAAPNETGLTPALWIQANVTQTVGHWFLYVSGFQSGAVVAQAISGVNVTPNGGCMYILDTGNTQDALNVTGSGALNASGCAVNVWSSNSKAFEVQGGSASARASAFNVHGSDNVSGGALLSPAATTGVAVPSTSSTAYNPLVNLPAPSFNTAQAGCDFGTGSNAYSTGVNATISHGVYCGGITVSGGTLTLNAGTYILNGGGLVVQGSGQLVGTAGVTFFFTGLGYEATKAGPLKLQGGNVNLVAPASGTYMGILFFQDPGATYGSQNVVSGGTGVSGSGTWYFPNTTLTFSGSSSASAKMAFVVKDLTLSGSSSIAQDTTGIYTGLASRKATLIE